MKSKLIVVFTFSFLVFLGFVIWRSGSTIQEDKLNFAQTQGRLQVAATAQALEFRLSQLAQGLVTELKVADPAQNYFAEQGLLKDFVFIGQYSLESASFTRKHFSKENDVASWIPNYGLLALKTFDFKDLRAGSFAFLSLLSPQREPYAMMIFRSLVEDDQVAIAVVKKHTLQSIIDRQKASVNEVYLVNEQGFALAHSTPEYIHSILSEDPLVSQIISGADSGGVSIYRNLRGEDVQSVYDRVPKTNLFLISSVELGTLTAVGQQLQLQLLFVGAGFILIAVGILILVYRPEKILSVISTETAKVQTVKSMETQKLYLSKDFAKSVVHEFRGSVSNLISNSKVLSQSGISSDLKYNVERIQSHAQKLNLALQKLTEFAGIDKSEPVSVKLNELVQKSLQRLDGKIKSQKIQLQTKLLDVPNLAWPEGHLLNAFESLIQNSIDAMNRVAVKNLVVGIEKSSGKWVITISDTGEGISKNNLQKIYDPFFSTRSGTHHSGLGLTRSLGIVNECGGDIEVQSEEGKGTTVKVFLPEAGLQAEAKPSAVAAVSSKINVEAVKEESKVAPTDHVMTAPKAKPPVEKQAVEESLGFNLDFLAPLTGTEKPSASKEVIPSKLELSDVPLLTDRTIENMIDENIEFPADPIEIETKDDSEYLTAPAAPAVVQVDVPKVPMAQFSKPVPSSKVDKPKPRASKTADLDLTGVQLPKAGEALPGDI